MAANECRGTSKAFRSGKQARSRMFHPLHSSRLCRTATTIRASEHWFPPYTGSSDGHQGGTPTPRPDHMGKAGVLGQLRGLLSLFK